MMTRKNDSRNEIFLSALDLFTLLLFAFMGTTLRPDDAQGEPLELPLPIASESADTHAIDRASTIQLKWMSKEDAEKRTGLCRVAVSKGNEVKPPLQDVPCALGGFVGEEFERSASLDALKIEGTRVLIQCNRNDAPVDCLRLQWIVGQHGLTPLLMVDTKR